MEVYCIWGYDHYYPTGHGDLKGVFFDRDVAEEALDRLRADCQYDHYRITVVEPNRDLWERHNV